MTNQVVAHLLGDGSIEVRSEDEPNIALATLHIQRGAHDGALVIQIDTDEDAGQLRVHVDDWTVYDADPAAGDHHDTLGDYTAALLQRLPTPVIMRNWPKFAPPKRIR